MASHNFMARVEPELNSGCWLWSGAMTGDGYGCLTPPGRRRTRAHRWSLILSGVAVAADDVVLHRCDTPLCVNPAHLRVGTHADNVADMRAKGRAGSNKGKTWKLPAGSRAGERHNRFGVRKTHCANGHPFTPENTAFKRNGAQRCRTCMREQALRAYHAKKGRGDG